jgi:hypothetical protein
MEPKNRGIRPILTRIASLKGFKGVLIGRDMEKVFEEGKVYGIRKIAGEIFVTELGEHAMAEYLEGNRINAYMTSGIPLLTREEYEIEKKQK